MALAWLKRILGGLPAASTPTKARPGFRPTLDRLEDRLVPVTAVTDLTGALTAQDLVTALIGNNTGIAVSNVQYRGDLRAAGTFSGGQNSVGMSDGVLLSTGIVSAGNVVGPHTNVAPSNNVVQPGDAQLNQIAAPGVTVDAAVLEFDFVPTGNTITLSYVFGSADYDENIAGPGDVVGIFVNGKNSAFVPGTTTPIGVTTINAATNSQFFIDNTAGSRNTRIDGFTTVFNATLSVNANAINHLKLAIADVGAATFDSVLLIGADGATALNGTAINGLDTGNISTYRPLRYVFNAATTTFDGNITIVNRYPYDLVGPNFAILSAMPTGVTVANPTGITAAGNPFFAVPATGTQTILFRQQPARIYLKLRNPGNVYLSSFFEQYDINVTSTLA